MTDAILTVNDVVKTFGGVTAVDGASLRVPSNQLVGLIGPNGAGKTTLFNTIAGSLSPDSGSIQFKGQDITGHPPYRLMRSGLGRTFQVPRGFDGMSVRENLMFAAQDQLGESPIQSVIATDRVQAEQEELESQADEILSFLDLIDIAEEYGDELSGGQKKLLELGRVLMAEPELLLLDEPIAGVNPELGSRLIERLHDLVGQGKTILMIEHDLDVIMEHCKHIFVMDEGEAIASGTPGDIASNEAVVDAYLGGM